jgi:hypothetical protein
MKKYTQGTWFKSNSFIRTEKSLIAEIMQIRKNGSALFIESEANASLIAAAPELLEVLKACEEKMRYLDDAPSMGLWARMKDAIARAEER